MENNLLELLHAIYSEIKQTNLRLDKLENDINDIKTLEKDTHHKMIEIGDETEFLRYKLIKAEKELFYLKSQK